MVTIDLTTPLIKGVTGEKVQNADGSVSVKCPEGYLSVDSTGAIKFAPSIAQDEQFRDAGTALIATNTFSGVHVWIIPYAEHA